MTIVMHPLKDLLGETVPLHTRVAHGAHRDDGENLLELQRDWTTSAAASCSVSACSMRKQRFWRACRG